MAGVYAASRDTNAHAHRIGVRPEQMGVTDAGQGIAATVELAEQLGDASIIHLRIEGLSDLVIAKIGGAHAALHSGQHVGLVVDASRPPLAFDSQTQLLPAL
mgnify:CR=1 FL=1